MSNQQIAKTILNQLGAGRFVAMTGAKNFVAIENGLSFNIPSSKGINRVKIVLDVAQDLYNVEFAYYRALKYTVKKTHEGVYCDMLEKIFEQETGLYTRL